MANEKANNKEATKPAIAHKKRTRVKLQESTMLTTKDAQEARVWFEIDANGKTLGRLASELTRILRGKHRTSYTPHIDCGDGVIVLNAEKIKVTGNKEASKEYYHYTHHIGGLRCTSYRTMMERKPTEILRLAVKGMMPRTKLARAQMKRLRIFKGEQHDMAAQKPHKI